MKTNILLSCLLLSTLINSSCFLNTKIDRNDKIKISTIKYSNVSYGKERISFEVNPKINSDEILYSLKYEDDIDVENDIFDVYFMPKEYYMELTCLRPFYKRVILTIYSKANNKIKDSINIDFKERISVNPTLNINENSSLSINQNLTTTGGSIKIDKTVKNEQFNFSDSFILLIKEKLKDRFTEKYYTNPQTTSYYENSCTYIGIKQSDCSYWFNNSFTYADFLNSIYYEVDYNWIESDSDYETNEVDRIYIYELLEEDFYYLFDGNSPVFTYSCVINNQIYYADFGININDIDIYDLKINKKDIIF